MALMGTSRRCVTAALALTFALPLPGQTIRGRVLLSDSTTPALGIVVTAIAEGGAVVGRGLSTASGDYTIRLPLAGRYQLRALRIGFRPTIVDSINVGANETRIQNIMLGRLPVTIAGMIVRNRKSCDLAGSDIDRFVQLWEQARAALAATHLSEQSGNLDMQVLTLGGHIDAVNYFTAVGREWSGSPYADVDTVHAREAIVDRVFAITPAETLLAAGYVRRRENGAVVFDAPSAEMLLSDEFVAQHCFSVGESSREHPDWLGIGFVPQNIRDSIVDIRGVVWLDRSSAELRRIEFEYTNLPAADLRLCDSEPDRNLPVVQGHPVCDGFNNTRDRLGLGGYADLRRLATGEWLIVQWMIRTPPDGAKYRNTKERSRQATRGTSETCYLGKDCREVWSAWPRLVTTTGIVSRVVRGGTEIYRNDSSAALISAAAAKRAGKHPAHLEGVITDSSGRPLANVTVQAGDPGRVAMTDIAGVFHLDQLPGATIVVATRCRGYRSTRFTLPLLPDSTRHLSLRLVADAKTIATSNCTIVK